MKQIFSVPEIHCSSCLMLLEGLEEDHSAIKNVRTDLIKREVEIEFDELKMSTNEIIEAIDEISGYKATPNAN
jgi:copper chaperone CopZ